ncbi:hypothetical protein JCM6882_008093 [Rhodosporidiobolus microsporus]
MYFGRNYVVPESLLVPPSRDHFSRLPPELIDEIYRLAYRADSRHYPAGPPARAFVAAHREHRFREVLLSDWPRTRRFAGVLEGYPSLGKIVKRLSAKLPLIRAEDPAAPTIEELQRCFRRLQRVENFTIDSPDRVLASFLDETVTRDLQHLHTLAIKSDFSSWTAHGNPFDVSLYRVLDCLPALRSWILDVEVDDEDHDLMSAAFPAPSAFTAPAYWSRLHTLTLCGSLTSSRWIDLALRHLPSSLESLTLFSTAYPGGLSSALSSILNPSSIKHLALYLTLHGWDDGNFSTISRFTSLESLAFEGDINRLRGSLAFHKLLAALPLRELRYMRDTPFSTTGLLHLLRTSTTLARLRLYTIFPFRPLKPSQGVRRRLVREHGTSISDADLHPYAFSSWVWSDACTVEGLREVLKLASEKSVRVEGDGVEQFMREGFYEERAGQLRRLVQERAAKDAAEEKEKRRREENGSGEGEN